MDIYSETSTVADPMSDKRVETLCSKIWFSSILETFSPLPPKQCLFSTSNTAQTAAPTQCWIGGAGYQRVNARCQYNRISEVKYRKVSFPKSVSWSTTFVVHCKLWWFPLYFQAPASLFLQNPLNVWFRVICDYKTSDQFLFLKQIPIQRWNLVYPINQFTLFCPQGGVYCHFFTFKVFKKCLSLFQSMQFSPWHNGYKFKFFVQLLHFDEKPELVPFYCKILIMSYLRAMVYHYRWPHNDVTVTCAYHFDS